MLRPDRLKDFVLATFNVKLEHGALGLQGLQMRKNIVKPDKVTFSTGAPAFFVKNEIGMMLGNIVDRMVVLQDFGTALGKHQIKTHVRPYPNRNNRIALQDTSRQNVTAIVIVANPYFRILPHAPGAD
jgi:hypothetical protein